ncbi:MAG: NAD(+) synthase [Planctomycetota bacterium]
MASLEQALRIDAGAEVARISEFIRTQVMQRFRRKGLVVGLSGGVDSALLAALSVNALGSDRVLGLILPEKESSPESERLARDQAEELGIRTETVDLTPILETLGVYRQKETVIRRLFPDFDPESDRTKITLPGGLLESDALNVYFLTVVTTAGETRKSRLNPDDHRSLMAAQNMKQRSRMMQLYRRADALHYVVGGTTNLPEYEQGLFVKHGDGGVDIEPLAHLYKTQVFALAEHVGVLEAIRTRRPSPDTWSAEVGDEEFFYRMPVSLVDLFLCSLKRGLSPEEIGRHLDLETEQVERVIRDLESKKRTTWHLRGPVPDLRERDEDEVRIREVVR